MRVIGLTGGIASGKSTVSGMLRQMGVPVVDADLLARQAVAPGTPAEREIREVFGAGVFRPDGSLDRQGLGDLVFADPAARARLNAIVHPFILARSQEELRALSEAGHGIAVYDAALILENGLGGAMDGLIVVSVPQEVQLARLRARDGIDEATAMARIRAQLPLAQKAARADWLIDNSKSLDETRRHVELVWSLVRERFGA
ncbi:MAG: dephospho-CoA kinase [Deltaproteobacteria bacterium]|nr:dephospho-CoA kinase [Deltaproteobacteria bacterium]